MINLIRIGLFLLRFYQSKSVAININRLILRTMRDCKIHENIFSGKLLSIKKVQNLQLELEIDGDLKQKLIKSQTYSIIDLRNNKLIYQCRIGK